MLDSTKVWVVEVLGIVEHEGGIDGTGDVEGTTVAEVERESKADEAMKVGHSRDMQFLTDRPRADGRNGDTSNSGQEGISELVEGDATLAVGEGEQEVASVDSESGALGELTEAVVILLLFDRGGRNGANTRESRGRIRTRPDPIGGGGTGGREREGTGGGGRRGVETDGVRL